MKDERINTGGYLTKTMSFWLEKGSPKIKIELSYFLSLAYVEFLTGPKSESKFLLMEL